MVDPGNRTVGESFFLLELNALDQFGNPGCDGTNCGCTSTDQPCVTGAAVSVPVVVSQESNGLAIIDAQGAASLTPNGHVRVYNRKAQTVGFSVSTTMTGVDTRSTLQITFVPGAVSVQLLSAVDTSGTVDGVSSIEIRAYDTYRNAVPSADVVAVSATHETGAPVTLISAISGNVKLQSGVGTFAVATQAPGKITVTLNPTYTGVDQSSVVVLSISEGTVGCAGLHTMRTCCSGSVGVSLRNDCGLT